MSEPLSSNQMGMLVRELRVMARGLSHVADDGAEHSEVELLLAASTLLNTQQDEIERLRAALDQAEGALRMMEHAYDNQSRPNVMMLRETFKAIRATRVAVETSAPRKDAK